MKLICYIFLLFSFSVFGQAELEIELKTGVTINGKKMNMSQDQFDLNLRNGYSYGLGFDIWLPKNFGVSFGYSLSNSNVYGKISFPENFAIGSSRKYLARLSDRIFYIGMKKKLELSEKTSVSPFLGFIYNSYYLFEFTESTGSAGVLLSTGEYHSYNTKMLAGYESFGNNFYGSIGAKFGVTLEQDLGNCGRVALNVSYGLDLTRNLWITGGAEIQTTIEDENGILLEQNTSGTLENEYNRGRNLLMIELGYKMPCSINLGKGKEVKNL